jgi:hypothetical protein
VPAVLTRLLSCVQSTVPAQAWTEAWSVALKPDSTSVKSIRRFCSQSEKLTPSGFRFCGRGVFVTSVAARRPVDAVGVEQHDVGLGAADLRHALRIAARQRLLVDVALDGVGPVERRAVGRHLPHLACDRGGEERRQRAAGLRRDPHVVIVTPPCHRVNRQRPGRDRAMHAFRRPAAAAQRRPRPRGGAA